MAVSRSAPVPYPDPVYEFFGSRRRSVDTGGLALALKGSNDAGEGLFGLGRGLNLAFGWGTGTGWGWGGWDDLESAEGPL